MTVMEEIRRKSLQLSMDQVDAYQQAVGAEWAIVSEHYSRIGQAAMDRNAVETMASRARREQTEADRWRELEVWLTVAQQEVDAQYSAYDRMKWAWGDFKGGLIAGYDDLQRHQYTFSQAGTDVFKQFTATATTAFADFINPLSDNFADLGTLVDSVMGSMVKSVTDAVARMAVEWAITKGAGFLGSIWNNIFHEGGEVGPVIGGDEVPALLQVGEWVLSRADAAKVEQLFGSYENFQRAVNTGFANSVTRIVGGEGEDQEFFTYGGGVSNAAQWAMVLQMRGHNTFREAMGETLAEQLDDSSISTATNQASEFIGILADKTMAQMKVQGLMGASAVLSGQATFTQVANALLDPANIGKVAVGAIPSAMQEYLGFTGKFATGGRIIGGALPALLGLAGPLGMIAGVIAGIGGFMLGELVGDATDSRTHDDFTGSDYEILMDLLEDELGWFEAHRYAKRAVSGIAGLNDAELGVGYGHAEGSSIGSAPDQEDRAPGDVGREFHSGGILNLRDDEGYFIGLKGEEVTKKENVDLLREVVAIAAGADRSGGGRIVEHHYHFDSLLQVDSGAMVMMGDNAKEEMVEWLDEGLEKLHARIH